MTLTPAASDPVPGAGDRRQKTVWLWTLGYAVLALPFVPFWPDYETARRGIGLAMGAVALSSLAFLRAEADLPRRLHATWLLVVLVHGLSCTWAQNAGDAWARSLWLLALWGFATLAARTSSLRQQLAALEWPGLAVFAYGIAQALGLTWPFGFDHARDAVSTLGNRNVASEFAVLALVAASLRLLRHHRVTVPAAGTLLGAAYVWLNHSRAGLLAAGLTLLPLVLAPGRQHPPRRRLLLLALLAAGVAAGQALAPAVEATPAAASQPTTPPDTEHAATDLDGASPRSTVEVRTEMWASGVRMLRAAPLFGVGAGQFKVHYPRFRSQREIELSTHGYAFLAAPRTPHQDPLEVAIDVGLIGFVPFAAFWLLVLRGRRRGLPGLLPVVAFLVLGLVRSPLSNAPAAAFAFACLGALCREQQSRRGDSRRWRWPLLLGAVAMAYVGVRETAGQCAAAPAVAARVVPPDDPRRHALDELHALDRATALCPWDASLRELQVSRRLDLAAERHDRDTLRALTAPDGGLTRLLRLKPFSTGALVLAAHVQQAGGDLTAASASLRRVLAQDEANPEARLFLATLCTQAGAANEAIATLYAGGHPYPRLRQGLAQHLQDLANLARTDADRALLAREAAFIAAVDALQRAPNDPATVPKVREFAQVAEHSAAHTDLRALILIASAALQRGDHTTAEQAAARAPDSARLLPEHAPFLHEIAQPLRALPAWAPLLVAVP